jgi:uncharacterized protein
MNAQTDSRFLSDFTNAWRPDHLHLILMPTEKCNFRCVYCYEDFKVGRMAAETVESVKKLIALRAPDLKSLEINWFGGEPTVALDIVRKVMDHAAVTCDRHDVRLRAGMTTNGYLLDGQAYGDLVRRKVVDFQISVDGPQEFHDRTRLQANGKGSFERIFANLHEIKERSERGEILIRVHMTRKNSDAIPGFADWLKTEFGDDDRFSFTLQPVENLGGDADLSDLVLPKADRLWGENSVPSKTDGGMERAHDDRYVCYAAKANSFVIRADGRIGKCTVALNRDYNTIGQLRPDGTLALDEPKTRRWLEGWTTGEQPALGCPAAALF